jgi:tRNA 2-selenouridine synthase
VIETVEDAGPAATSQFDEIIDVRSPAEFAEDHVPGAINLPVLSDAERIEVGTLYVQQSKFLARRIGAAHVSRNIAGHLSTALSDKTGAYHPLVYCWRGGQRSSAMATVLSQVGWRVGLLQGGYKTYRRRVTGVLYDSDAKLNAVLLAGKTGSGKTELLALLGQRGLQIIDLEALANHRGSLFGADPTTPQPSQKMFESRLLAAIEGLDPNAPTVIEAESSRIGALFLPPLIWKAMEAAPHLEIQAPAAARARYIAATYSDFAADPDRLSAALNALPHHHSREDRASWRALAASGETEALARALIDAHYDPAYRRSATKGAGWTFARLALNELSPGELSRTADAAAATIAALPRRPYAFLLNA